MGRLVRNIGDSSSPIIDKLMKAQSERLRLGSLIRMANTNRLPTMVNAPHSKPDGESAFKFQHTSFVQGQMGVKYKS